MDHRTSLRSLANLNSYASTAEALQAAGLDWNVELERLTSAGGHNAPARAVVRSDTRKPLGVVGLRYAPCDNVTATRWLDQYIPHGLRITGAEAFKGGERCVMYGLLGDQPAEVRKGDFVALQLVVSWSHDGSSSTTAGLRALRLVCTNGLVLASEAGRMFSLRHTRHADPTTDEIQFQVRQAIGRFGESMEAFRALADRSVTTQQVRDFAKQVMAFEPDATTGALSTRADNVLDNIVARHRSAQAVLIRSAEESMDAGRGQQLNGGGTWWNAYNAITEYLTHDRGRTVESRQESLLFGSSARLNERALALAMNMSGVA
jgi:phage/plasmid-like protein (TIGR03299 family)